MENCLANTGASSSEIILLAIAVIGIATIFTALSRRMYTRASRGIFTFALVGSLALSSLSPTFTYADACPPTAPTAVISSKPITSSGNATDPQSINVLQFVTPSAGATIVTSTLALGLPDSPVPGSTVSPDGKTVTVPGEGTYVATGDGTITFTPAADFGGTIQGVIYTIKDSGGRTTTNTYIPVIERTTITLPSFSADPQPVYNWSGPGEYDYTPPSPGTVMAATGLAANITNTATGLPLTTNLADYIDLDPTTPGIQRTLDHASDEGWTAQYTPATDTFTFTITNGNLFTVSIEPNPSGWPPLVKTRASVIYFTVTGSSFTVHPESIGTVSIPMTITLPG